MLCCYIGAMSSELAPERLGTNRWYKEIGTVAETDPLTMLSKIVCRCCLSNQYKELEIIICQILNGAGNFSSENNCTLFSEVCRKVIH